MAGSKAGGQGRTQQHHKGSDLTGPWYMYALDDDKYPALAEMARRRYRLFEFFADHGAEAVPDQKFAGLLCNDMAPLWQRLMASNVKVTYSSAQNRSDLAGARVTDPSAQITTGWTFFGNSSAMREVVFEKQFQNPEAWYKKRDEAVGSEEKSLGPRELAKHRAAKMANAYFREDESNKAQPAPGGFLKRVMGKILDEQLTKALDNKPVGWWGPLGWWAGRSKRKAIRDLSARASEHRLALQLLDTVLNKIDSGAEGKSTASLTGAKDTSIGHQIAATVEGLLACFLSCSCQVDEWKAYFVEVHWWTQNINGEWETTYNPENVTQPPKIPADRTDKIPKQKVKHQDMHTPLTAPPSGESKDEDIQESGAAPPSGESKDEEIQESGEPAKN